MGRRFLHLTFQNSTQPRISSALKFANSYIAPVVTRKRRENNALIGQVALLLIDEGIAGKHNDNMSFHCVIFLLQCFITVHLLADERGASLESVA